MDGRPVLIGGQRVQGEDGRKGIIFEVTKEAEALLRWQVGELEEADGHAVEAQFGL